MLTGLAMCVVIAGGASKAYTETDFGRIGRSARPGEPAKLAECETWALTGERDGIDRDFVWSGDKASAEQYVRESNADFPTLPPRRVTCYRMGEATPAVAAVAAIERVPSSDYLVYPKVDILVGLLGVLLFAGVAVGLTLVWTPAGGTEES